MIEVKHLTKRYGSHTAVADLSFTAESGKVYGLLGPNGAGKSTTMNIITGYLGADEGEITVDGKSVFDEPEEVKKSIGYMPEQPPLYYEMTPYEYLRFVAELKGVKKESLDDEVITVMQKTGVTEVADRLIKNLSKGYKQRVGFAQAITGSPETLIFDEPTAGLDPLQIREVRDLLKELGQEHTVILSSHILSEISAVCDEVMIISAGRLVATGTPAELEKKMKKKSLEDVFVELVKEDKNESDL